MSSVECRINFMKHQGGISMFLRVADHLHFSKFVNLQNVRCLNEGFGQPVKSTLYECLCSECVS